MDGALLERIATVMSYVQLAAGGKKPKVGVVPSALFPGTLGLLRPYSMGAFHDEYRRCLMPPTVPFHEPDKEKGQSTASWGLRPGREAR